LIMIPPEWARGESRQMPSFLSAMISFVSRIV
jgi:hypothetical protein